ncbi:putative toxin-antitoxin system toxin component, PIN family [Niveispirillum sp. KHB5.9]|uniref:putative toxin-antitoxin system toxin component, PIN family n=1 Tax=Niveispirillum sp. KHB5.9 TaxID=3400269 RepID=UPI003A837EEF
MRLVIDTNILISALLSPKSPPAALISLWRHGHFTLLTCDEQLDDLRRVTRYPKIRERLPPALAGRLINELRDLAILIENLPKVDVCPDPFDNYLLALSMAGQADLLVTGDKRDLLSLRRHGRTRIIAVSAFLMLE